ncbi:MAG TPA: caspase family protein [Terriglobia bacterium]
MLHTLARLLLISTLLVTASQDGVSALSGGPTPSQRGVQDVTSPSASTDQRGGYYALVIGNDRYRYLRQLQTAVNDANAVDQLLRGQYGFATKVLTNATRNQILTALNEYRRTLPENSNLLIYYAGHGHHDPDTDKAYWLPIDAQSDNNDNWISADDITSDVRAIPSLHVLIISDSCYSGAIARDVEASITPRQRDAYLLKMLKSRSRNLMSSGGDEPVADGGAPGHSVFAGALMESLRQIDQDEFTAAELFHRFVQAAVAGRSEQVPQYSVIRNSGHGYGDFVFSRKPAANESNFAAPLSDLAGHPSSGVAPSKPTTVPRNAPAQPPASTPGQVEQSPADSILGTPNVQRFPVAVLWWNIGAKDPIYDCTGWMWIENGMLRYRAITAEKSRSSVSFYTYVNGMLVFDIPFAQITEVKRDKIANQAFRVTSTPPPSHPAYFVLLDNSMQSAQNPSSLINAVRAAMGAK